MASVGVLSVGWLAGCTAGGAASDPSSVRRPTVGPGETTVRVLQMNLCNSGRADCYSGGRAVTTAAALVSDNRPDVVSLNEVCRDDLDVLERAMSAAFHAAVASAFKPALDRPTNAPVRCQNGLEFGDGVLAVLSSADRRFRIHSGVYPIQDPNDVEARVWVCLDLVSQSSACATHLASTDTTIALAQCRYLLSSVARMLRRHADGDPTIVAGDLNIAAGGSPDPQSCLPRGYQRADDGALQDVVASPGVAIRSRSVIDMRGATDHPALLVDLVLPRR
jgi:endonuclease/exonuclease/phosphatase family metal-dependent hydrolase